MTFLNSFISGVGCTSGVIFMLYVSYKINKINMTVRYLDTVYLSKNSDLELESILDNEENEDIHPALDENKFKKLFDKLL